MHCRTDQFKLAMQEMVEKHGAGRENLLAVLRDVVDKFGHISGSAMIEVSRFMDVPIGEIHGVATFYSLLNTSKKGDYVIRLCQTISCDMAGKAKVAKVIERELGVKFGETTHDGVFTLEYTNCMGMCDQGPAMMVNNEVYGSLTPEKVVDIIDRCREERIK